MARRKSQRKARQLQASQQKTPAGIDTQDLLKALGGISSSGKTVSTDKALQLSAVWSCVRLLSESISTLPLKIYLHQEDGSRVIAKDHPAYRVLCRRPNAEMTPSRFMLMVVASLCLQGNAYIEKRYIGGKLVSLQPLLPQLVTVKRLDNGLLDYQCVEQGGKNRPIPVKNMMHIRGFGLDGVVGLTPIQVGRNILGSAIATDETAAKIFRNGLLASGFLSSKTALTKEQREKLRGYLNAFISSENAGKLMILENDLSYNGISMNPEDAQLLQSRSWSIEEICRWFRVPPFMVGHADKQSSWASSVEGMNMQFLTNTLRPLLVNIEQEINRCLLDSDDDYYAEFSVEGLLRADSAGRAAYYTTALQNGWMSRNDVRRLENLPPIEGGDIYTVQLNLTPIEQLGKDTLRHDPEQLKAQITNWLFPEGTPTVQHNSPHIEE
ncbi:phage portal protein [Providencia stuartii]|uniref:phage portal protein n=1 Tax=Providencia stuartii TaxID=588 RepID=UPI0011402273|nr:phage portal protein [Providencia stuartii]TPW67595.1 phage portal protein [Providencia stuartii]WAZ73637.1 phage portal protein [Providencia stuartii]WAZ80010.1 phage portal protein [Providencia stuartii]WAZ82765.1 phage portal protein [Providencia stuartii]HAU5735483.1 phage portal protein [Providencia stuartii]